MIFRLGIRTRDWSTCNNVVEKSSIFVTCPDTPAISIHSPTRNGLVKMMHQAGDEIAQYALQGQTDADAGHADARQRRADGHAQFLQAPAAGPPEK